MITLYFNMYNIQREVKASWIVVFTTKPDMVRNVDVLSGMSDHDLVLLDVNLRPSRNKKPPRKVFMFKRGNMDSVRYDLGKAFEDYLSSVAPFKSVQENYLFFKEKIMAVKDS